jgi:hypothetical protein
MPHKRKKELASAVNLDITPTFQLRLRPVHHAMLELIRMMVRWIVKYAL